MKCPRDGAVLSSQEKGRLEVNTCPGCNGFSVVLSQGAAKGLEKQLQRHLSDGAGSSEVESLASPYTQEIMLRFNYRGIQLDYCSATHSVWFDRGEYSKIFQTPPPLRSKPTPALGERTSESRDIAEKVGTGIDVVDILGEVIGAIFVSGDLF